MYHFLLNTVRVWDLAPNGLNKFLPHLLRDEVKIEELNQFLNNRTSIFPRYKGDREKYKKYNK